MNLKLISLVLLSVILFISCQQQTKPAVKYIPEVERLLSQMTLEEKVGQMTQVTLDVITKGDNIYSSYEPLQLDTAILNDVLINYHVGSVLNTANNKARTVEKWNEVIGTIQKTARKNTRLGIPVLYGIDAIHGATYTSGATMFPQQIAMAATWNPELVRQAAAITAYEVRASSIHWNFSPVLDLGIDPRWPRMWETFGEDPYLCTQLGEQMIKGYQGDSLGGVNQVAACLKHFLGYSAAASGKDRTPAYLSEMALREYHLPAFKKAVEAGAASVMINSGIINGESVHGSKKLITDLLKNELGFEGLVVTDWYDIENLHTRDKIASSNKEAVKLAINAGIDMAMVPYLYGRYCDDLVELVQEGEVSMDRIDDAVRRILNVKYQLGLFNQNGDNCHNYPKFGSSVFEKVAYTAASEAITLLKNDDDLLPLQPKTRLLVCGPNANSMRTLNGGWTYSWQGEKTDEFAQEYNTILEAIQAKFGMERVRFVPGVEYKMDGSYWEETNVDIASAVKAAKQCDVIILCLGENSYTEKPGDLHDLAISTNQAELAKQLSATGKPVVLVLNEGRPRIISSFANQMGAIIQTYLSGNYAGDALADILAGDVNPSGKLPYTYPMFSNSLAVYNHKPSEESKTAEGMYDYGGGFYPQFEFGHGLSYTTFEYSQLKVSTREFTLTDTVNVWVRVKNTGNRVGKEVVQLYSSDLYASVTPDIKRLRRFKKVELQPGEEVTMVFGLTARDLAFVDATGKWISEPGDFELQIGDKKIQISLKSEGN
nr:glycoside hydrolase family 3 N-terminal domain-containing protein [uncultured Carboxylicivirga sp.]